MYNIHPIIVHFPIALLVLYSLIKIIPVRRLMPNVEWRHIELVLLLVGVAGAFLALSTGEIAEEIIRTNEKLVDTHAFFASLSTWVYGLLLAGEILSSINQALVSRPLGETVFGKFLRGIERIINNKGSSIFLAFLGLVSITVTGMLGGIIVFGTTADPLAELLLQILGINL